MSKRTSAPLTPALSPEGERGRSSSAPLTLTLSPRGERQAFRHLYVHIPFCKHKCGYCDFNAYAGMDRLMPDYVDALERELAFARERHPFQQLDTVYLGGGTPSLLPADLMSRLLAFIRATFNVAPDAEGTLEANPASTDETKVAAWLDGGVNRLSLGVQGFDPRALAVLERKIDAACTELEAAGFRRYEVSNWAHAGFESRHNQAYWRCRPVYGAGAGAHSYATDGATAWRWWNVARPREYIAAAPSPRADGEELDSRKAAGESLMLGLRTVDGAAVPPGFDGELRRLQRDGLVRRIDGRVVPTRRGLDLHNQIALAVL